MAAMPEKTSRPFGFVADALTSEAANADDTSPVYSPLDGNRHAKTVPIPRAVFAVSGNIPVPACVR
jgi:hypothetical protein